jgi:hypothetical protein
MSPRRKSSRADGKSPDALSSSNAKVVASNGMEPQPPQARLLGARGTCPVCAVSTNHQLLDWTRVEHVGCKKALLDQ